MNANNRVGLCKKVCFILLAGCVVGCLLTFPNACRTTVNRFAASISAPKLLIVPSPQNVPYSGEAKRLYVAHYERGYGWAWGTHRKCPPNADVSPLPAIHGWFDGWEAGLADGGADQVVDPTHGAAYELWQSLLRGKRGGPGEPDEKKCQEPWKGP